MKRIQNIIVCLALVLTASAKPSFRTSELERLAQVLALDVDVLPDGYSHPVANGIRLTVHQTDQTILANICSLRRCARWESRLYSISSSDTSCN